jgi:hypothetical protein
LDGLPAPALRYFRAVLKDGQPFVRAVSIEHTGTFNMSKTGEQWVPFTSMQRVVTRRPGFVWDARMCMMPKLAHGELMRFYAEGAWYPTSLLPSQGVTWEAIDDSRASATIADGTTTVKLVFQSDFEGLISSIHSDGRYREADGMLVSTPWQGRSWGYEIRDGMLVPLEGEVAWLLPGGEQPYWRGRISRLNYELAE